MTATSFVKAAVDLVASEQYDRISVWQCGKVTNISLGDAIAGGIVLIVQILHLFLKKLLAE